MKSSGSDISAELNRRMESLARHLLGEPNRALSSKQQWRYGNKGSLAIEIAGQKAGTWFDHEEGIGGNVLDLVARQRGLCNGAVFDWARQWLRQSISYKGERHDQTISSDQQNPCAHENLEPPQGAKTPEQLAAKVAEIVSACTEVEGTPAQYYLQRRGIVAQVPDCLRFRPNAFNGYGALVAFASDDSGNVLALQQIYLTNDGRKAPVDVVKRTNKAVEDWSEKAAVRFPGTAPIVLAEGVETALSIWQATGCETWACLGISNIRSAPLPKKTEVIVARDGDIEGSKADNQIKRAVAHLQSRGLTVSVATPPEGKDFNDLLLTDGEEAVRDLINGAKSFILSGSGDQARTVFIGSDVEIAGRVREDMIEKYGQVIYAEGAFWRYDETHWAVIPDHELRLATHIYDGAKFKTPKGEPSLVKLGKSRVDSILHELASLVTKEDFFRDASTGINCANGFIRFSQDGMPSLAPHDPDHRCRHTLPGKWHAEGTPHDIPSTLLDRLLKGVFCDDHDAIEKTTLLSEVCGCAALGYATKLVQPRAIILKGERAENGKSQILDLARGLLPPTAISSVPAARMGDERHVIGLVGKLLNASDELSSSSAVASDTFKAVVTGEPIDGRDVYKSRLEFRPIAQHIFATNTLPPFQGGMDRGVQRRLLVITFNRVIPLHERVEAIGRKIATDEADLLLTWAVQGASRLIRQRNFTIPSSSKIALTDWILGADPVLAWLDECVEVKAHVGGFPNISTRTAYERFHAWAVAEGFNKDKLPAINGFVQRVQANAAGIESKRTSSGRVLLGLSLKHASTGQMPYGSKDW